MPPPSNNTIAAAAGPPTEPRLVLRVDFPHDCLAGTAVSGRVYLLLPPARQQQWQGIHVRLQGVEYAVTASTTGGKARQRNSFFVTEQPIVTWNGSRSNKANSHHHLRHHPADNNNNNNGTAQHLEFPFTWRLPANLPASMSCRKSSTEKCRIEYTVEAFLVSRLGEQLHGSTVLLQVRSQAVRRISGSSAASSSRHVVKVPRQRFDIYTNLVFCRGHVEMDVELSTDVVSPGTNLRVGVTGCNHSKVAVKDFLLRLVERVSWKAVGKGFVGGGASAPDNTGGVVTQERILAQERIWTGDVTQWQGNNNGAKQKYAEQETLWNLLRIPESAGSCRASHVAGQWIRVTHAVVVIAETAMDRTTNPRCVCPVRLVNASRGDQMLQQQQAAALVLPTDWEPVVAPVLEIPDALVVPHARARIVVVSGDNSNNNQNQNDTATEQAAASGAAQQL